MNLLKTPKKLYYDYLHGVDMDSSELTAIIDNAMDNANNLKIKLQKEMCIRDRYYAKIKFANGE